MKNEIHQKYIKLCFELAARGKGYVSPNPLVGAVIVKHGKIIGKGYHTGDRKIQTVNELELTKFLFTELNSSPVLILSK